jgi:hypothetical protein
MSTSSRRYSASERDDGLYSMSSVSVDLGESAARSKHQHTFSKPDPRPAAQQPPRPGAYDRPGKYSNYFDQQRSAAGSNEFSGKR